MICPECGKLNPTRTLYCVHCRERLPDPQSTYVERLTRAQREGGSRVYWTTLGIFITGVVLLIGGIVLGWTNATDPGTVQRAALAGALLLTFGIGAYAGLPRIPGMRSRLMIIAFWCALGALGLGYLAFFGGSGRYY
jgi:hypothetical protein